MANNYLEYSAFLEVPAEKIEQARTIVAREIARLEADDEWGYCGTGADVEGKGVWFYAEESGNTDHVEAIARTLVEELEIAEPFCCSWAYTCSRPRIGEFGGGAMVVRRGYETIWIDAMDAVQEADKARLPNASAKDQVIDDSEVRETLVQLEDIVSGIEAQADNLGINMEEARYWWQKARKLIDKMKVAA